VSALTILTRPQTFATHRTALDVMWIVCTQYYEVEYCEGIKCEGHGLTLWQRKR
jgi:hypothetical protein